MELPVWPELCVPRQLPGREVALRRRFNPALQRSEIHPCWLPTRTARGRDL